jgi:hypothetical protein
MRLFLALAALAALGCAKQSVDVPEPPDMSGLLAAYQAPSAPLSAATVAEIVARRTELVDQFERLGGLEPVLASLGALGGQTDVTSSALAGPGETESLSSALQAGGITVTGDGFLTLTRVCTGWEAAASPDPADGSIALTAVFSDEGFEAVVWGEARDCRYRFDGHDLRLDGQVRLHTGTLLVGGADGAELTIDFDGSAEVDGQGSSSTFSFRVAFSSSRVEIELDVSAGNVVFFADEVTKSYGFRAANGTWTCDFEAGICAHDGDTLSLW